MVVVPFVSEPMAVNGWSIRSKMEDFAQRNRSILECYPVAVSYAEMMRITVLPVVGRNLVRLTNLDLRGYFR